MTTKFSKDEGLRITNLILQIGIQRDAIEGMWPEFEEIVAKINTAIDVYNEIVHEAKGVVDDIASEAESAYDEKSDKWRDGERGQAIYEWFSELQNLDLEDVEQIEVPEQPTLDHDGTLENVPQEAAV